MVGLNVILSFGGLLALPPWVLDIILNGYRIPFSVFPHCARFNNNKSAFDYFDFVNEAISELINAGSVTEVYSPPFVVNPLSVSVNSEGKCRLILDLRHVNQFIPKLKFKMEDSRVFLDYLQPSGFMFKFDMKSGYHHIGICPDHQGFLGFQWFLHNSVEPKYFIFTVLPFGLSSAPYVFTKVFRPLVTYWRSQGIPIVLYLDDGAVCLSDFKSAVHISNIVKTDLFKAGVVVNEQKSIWAPTQILEWLGLVWDLSVDRISIPERRIVSLVKSLNLLKRKFPFVTPREVASVTGKNCFTFAWIW